MKKLGKKELISEAEKQTGALKTIKRWLMYAVGASTIGAALVIAGFMGETNHIALGIFGIVLTVLSVTVAFIINLGLQRGTKNVKALLAAAEKL